MSTDCYSKYMIFIDQFIIPDQINLGLLSRLCLSILMPFYTFLDIELYY